MIPSENGDKEVDGCLNSCGHPPGVDIKNQCDLDVFKPARIAVNIAIPNQIRAL